MRIGALIAFSVAAQGLPAAAPGQIPGMVVIPAGDYVPLFRGGPGQTIQHVAAYRLDSRPVTNSDFLAFVAASPQWRRSRVPEIFADNGYLASWKGDLELGCNAPPGSPVVGVSWFAARAFAQWKGKRLPTTAEWERAAGLGFASERGADEPAYREAVLAWFAQPSPVVPAESGSGRPDIYGVRDLTDLVWEWVDDFNAPLGDSGADGALFCGSAAADASSFTDYPAFLRAGFRSSLRANFAMPNLGFRCAL